MKTTPKQPEQPPEQEEAESDHEWHQLIQMEEMIERHKCNLLETGAKDLWDMDDDSDALWEAEGGAVKEEDDSLDDGDLAYIDTILNSFSKPKFNHGKSNDPFTPEGALMRAPAPKRPPPKFNQIFNQNSTSYEHDERNLSCFLNFEEEGTTELADYFSDEEEDSLDDEDQNSGSDSWSQANSKELGEISDEEDTWSEHSATNFSLKAIPETDYEEVSERNSLKQISSIANKSELAFSEWQPYIPPEPVFRNSFAQSWQLAFSQPASSSLEPTLIQISTITGPITTTKQSQVTKLAITPRQKTIPSHQQDCNSFKPATKHFTHTWKKPWPGPSETCSTTKNSQNESPDHPEQSKPYRPWKLPSPSSPKTIQNQNTEFLNTPPETNAGDAHPVFTRYPSWTYSSMMSNKNITKIKSLETKSRRSSNKIQTDLSNKISEAYRTPSEKLGKDPVMALVSKTVAAYMFIRHNNKNKDTPTPTNFSSWAEPFFKKKE
jgi:hypothetical protein